MLLQNSIKSNYLNILHLALWLILIFYATWVHLSFGDFEAAIALRGWSAHDFTNSVLVSENFQRDYPGGSSFVGNSSLPWIYPALAYVGVPVWVSSPILISLEMMVLTLGAFYLMKTLFKDINSLSLVVLSVLFILSNIRYGDLARFSNPFFHGHFYGYADGISFFAIGLYFKKSFKASGALLSLGFTIHPIKTLSGFIFMSGCQVFKLRETFFTPSYFPYLFFLLVAFFWSYFFLSLGSTAIQITSQDFFKYSPLFNSHWYPQDLHNLTIMHLVYSTAFLSCTLIGLSSLLRSNLSELFKVQITLGVLAVCVISFLGLIFSWFEISPTLVKACLQRSSTLVLSLMTIIVIGQLFVDIKVGRWWYVSLGTLIVLAAFTPTRWAWPLLVSLIYVFTAIYSKRSALKSSQFLLCVILVLIIGVSIYEIYLFSQGFYTENYWTDPIKPLVYIIVGLTIYRLLIKRLLPSLNNKAKKYFPLALLILVAFQSYEWSEENHRLPAGYVEKGLSYRDVQIWARENTSYDALFMIDPTVAYGWRDFSQRSSFGTLQEWYKTGWLYSGDSQALNEGIRRGGLLGIEKLIPERSEKKNLSEFVGRAYGLARITFYEKSGKVLEQITRDNSIDYVVMNKVSAKAAGAIPAWSLAYDNEHYSVIIPPYKDIRIDK